MAESAFNNLLRKFTSTTNNNPTFLAPPPKADDKLKYKRRQSMLPQTQ